MTDTTPRFRADLKFTFDDYGLGMQMANYHLNDLIVQVEKKGANDEIRYGLMVEFESDDGYWTNNYIIEIPVPAGPPAERKAAQEDLIKQYITEMRDKFQSFFDSSTRTTTADEIHKVEQSLNSVEGQWDILRKFRQQHLVHFAKWLVNIEKLDDETYFKLVSNRMIFEEGAEYYITVDWAVPYITFEKEHLVDHFDTQSPHADHYFPFHNFHWQKLDLSSEVKIPKQDDYTYSHLTGITLKPNNYALFSYYSYLIDEIHGLQEANYQNVKHYHQYAINLSQIQNIIFKHSPLSKCSEQQVEDYIKQHNDKWDGDTPDHDDDKPGRHIAALARGFTDLSATQAIIGEIIEREAEQGRNQRNQGKIIQFSYSLKASLWDNPFARDNYSDLWAFNRDRFGIDLFLAKLMKLLADTEVGKDICQKYLVEMLYEHPALEETYQGVTADQREGKINISEWGNIFYRSHNLLFNTWMQFYKWREGTNSLRKHVYATKIGSQTPTPGHIAKWIGENEIFPNSIAGSSTPSQLYDRWELSDVKMRKLADYLLGGNKTSKLIAVEEAILDEIKILFSGQSFKEIPFDKIDELHAKILTVKNDLLTQKLNLPTDRISKTLDYGSAAVNSLLTVMAYSNASKSKSNEAWLRAHTTAIGLLSDVGNSIATMRGVTVSLNRSVLSTASGTARLAGSTLGRLQLIGGGVGGVLGAVWSSWDAFNNFYEGNSKDAILDTISAVGCMIGTVGLFLDATVIGLVPGIILNIVSFLTVLVAQLLKYFRTFSGKYEDYVNFLYGKDLEEGGINRLRLMEDEIEDDLVKIPFEMSYGPGLKELTALLERVDDFLGDWDTFDEID